MRILFFTVFVLAIITGCGSTARNQTASPTPNNQVKAQQTVPSKPEIIDRAQVANRLEKLSMSIPRVRGAHCVILGNTAIVGIDVDANLDRARVGTIKYSVAEALRKDPYGVNAIVTADMDLSQRLKEVQGHIRNGRPISGFADEMADIIGRIIPQMPRDVSPKDTQSEDIQDRSGTKQPNLQK